jgi:hypothetical protein
MLVQNNTGPVLDGTTFAAESHRLQAGPPTETKLSETLHRRLIAVSITGRKEEYGLIRVASALIYCSLLEPYMGISCWWSVHNRLVTCKLAVWSPLMV